jgi:peroxiredoxin
MVDTIPRSSIERPAPQFVLAATDGRLEGIPRSALTLLVFFRGHWCPYCVRYLRKLQSRLDDLRSRGVELLAISPEPLETSSAMAAELGLTFPVASDADGTVIHAYGIRNRFMGFGTLLPHPSVFLIDRQGVIRFRAVDRNYKKRTTIRTILSEVDAILER